MQSLGVTTLYVTGDGSPYGLALAVELKKAATGAGVTVVSEPGAEPTALFYCGRVG